MLLLSISFIINTSIFFLSLLIYCFSSRLCKINQIEVTEENFKAHIDNGKLTARTQEEETETGRVKLSVYSTFVTLLIKEL